MPIKPSPIRIRLARFGRRHQPLYNIVVANKKSARDSLPLEVLGTYNPIPLPMTPEEKARGLKPSKHIELDFHRSKYWLGVGADTSERVSFLFKRAGLLPEEWPHPKNLSQHIEKPIIREGETVYEEPKQTVRSRD